VAALTKTQAIFVLAIFLVVFVHEKKSILKLGAILYLMMLAVLAPWAVRNQRVMGKAVLSNIGGIVLMIGNNPYSTGKQMWDARVISLLGDLGADEDHMFDGREVARDTRARQVAVDFIIHHPVRVVSLWPKKFVGLYRSDVEGFYYALGLKNLGKKMRIVYIGLRVIGETYYLAMLGLWAVSLPVVLRSRRAAYSIGLVVCAYFTAVYLVFTGDPRYHLALIPWIAMYSGIGAAVVLVGEKSFLGSAGISPREARYSSKLTLRCG